MARAAAAAGVAVKVLVEQDEIAKVRILGIAPLVPVARAAPGGVGQEETRQPAAEIVGGVEQAHAPAKSGGQLDEQVVAVEVVVPLQRLDQEIIEGKPHRAAPV